jgi:HK97 family phage major capsid protein
MDDAVLVAYGGALKALGDGRIGGYLVVYGSAQQTDLAGDFFTPQTDFDLHDGERVTLYYNHGLDPVLKRRKLGEGTLRRDDAGIWMEAQLNLRDAYERRLYEDGIQAGKMGLSSGTLPHLVEREAVGKAQRITAWPLGKDASITPTPAEPRLRVTSLKSLSAAQPVSMRIRSDEEKTMTDPIQTLENDVLTERVDHLSATLNDFMKRLEDSPALRGAGYYSVDGGAADRNVRSLGDFLKAVQRNDERRLKSVYGSVKALNESSGEAGGYLVPAEYNAELLKITLDNSPILQQVRRVPVRSNTGKYPALDNYITPTAGSGQTAGASGVKTAKRSEGGAYSETEPEFQQIEWRINDAISGFTKVTKELSADSPEAIDSLLRMLISVADAAKQEHYVLHGTGVGEPLGVLNSAAAIGVDPANDNTFAYADALAMKSHFKAIRGGHWFVHRSLWPDIGSMAVGAGGAAVFQAQLGAELGNRLLGYPIGESEHLAQADNPGCVLLADFSAYLLFEKGGLEIEFSQHADFLNGNNVWRFSRRLDGQPWVRGPIKLADPQGGYLVSPFVYFAD